MQNVLGVEIVLQTKQIVGSPLRGSIGVRGELSDQSEGMLQADGIREPKTPALDGTRECKARIPVAQAHPLLNIDAGDWIRGAETPFVISVRSFEAKDIRAG